MGARPAPHTLKAAGNLLRRNDHRSFRIQISKTIVLGSKCIYPLNSKLGPIVLRYLHVEMRHVQSWHTSISTRCDRNNVQASSDIYFGLGHIYIDSVTWPWGGWHVHKTWSQIYIFITSEYRTPSPVNKLAIIYEDKCISDWTERCLDFHSNSSILYGFEIRTNI